MIFKVSKAICPSLNELHLSMKSFSYAIVVAVTKHLRDFFFPAIQSFAQSLKRDKRSIAAMRWFCFFITNKKIDSFGVGCAVLFNGKNILNS
ncbi:MAG: hypothetical protein BA863_19475 [Desulfovibrio sp. S3730MH75]|nr:MAG: hypothetical protein BA863_19475 [Desulfovibrio sp. S3730MH75]